MAFLELYAEGDVQITLNEEHETYLVEKDGKLTAFETDGKPATFTLLDERPKAAIYRAQRSWVILDYTGHQTLVNGLRVADYKRIHEGDIIQIGDAKAKLIEIRREIIAKGSALLNSDKRCCFCYDEFEVGQDVAYCTQCGEPYHFDCWLYFVNQKISGEEAKNKEAGGAKVKKAESKDSEEEKTYELQCPNCGALHRIDPKRHFPQDEQSQADGDKENVCPHCGQELEGKS